MKSATHRMLEMSSDIVNESIYDGPYRICRTKMSSLSIVSGKRTILQLNAGLRGWLQTANFIVLARNTMKQKDSIIKELYEALEHYQSAHYDSGGNACSKDDTAQKALQSCDAIAQEILKQQGEL